MAFPTLHPLAGTTISTPRPVKLTVRRYFNQRILDADGRFAKDIDYLLAAQYTVEQKQVADDISIALRQTGGQFCGQQTMNAGMFKDQDRLQHLLRQSLQVPEKHQRQPCILAKSAA